MIQNLVLLLVVGVLLGATAWAVRGAFWQLRRERHLGRRAHAESLRFAREDLFDVPRRYAELLLIGMGHGHRAENTLYGHVGGSSVRGFDLRFESGHGTYRRGRRYRLLVVELPENLPEGAIWRDGEESPAPLDLLLGAVRLDEWLAAGDRRSCALLARLCASMRQEGAGAQVLGRVVALWSPLASSASPQTDPLPPAWHVVRSLRGEEDDALER